MIYGSQSEPPALDFSQMKLFAGYGAVLRHARERAGGLSQAGLAERCGIHVKTIGNVENEKTDPTLGTVDAMLSALGVTLLDFCMMLASAQGIETPDVQSIEERERQRDKYKARVSSDIPLPSDPHQPTLRMLQDRIADLEARLYGVTPSGPFAPKGKPD